MQKQQRDYTSNDLVRVAKRENNKKRAYLLVNPSQGKHVPVEPAVAMDLFGVLGEQVNAMVDGKESVLVIAFAETATAIGAGILRSIGQDVYYLQTTRENVDGADYLYFSESHSHATEQRLVKDGLEEVLQKVDCIVFAEDEVTTGNTICNLMRELEKLSGGKSYHYVIASLLNGMTLEIEKSFNEKQIELCYLLKTNNEEYGKKVDEFLYDGCMEEVGEDPELRSVPTIQLSNYKNPRKVRKSKEYLAACELLARETVKEVSLEGESDVLVLGTEEFMYPGLLVARYLEEQLLEGHVRFHATTRSPILTSMDANYPLNSRYELRSLYEKARTTFIYNLKRYDKVVILTDANASSDEGLATLLHALRAAGNTNIMLVEWRK